MNFAIFWKMMKDGMRGLMTSLSPLFLAGLTGASAWITVAGGALSAIIGIVAGAVRGSQAPTSDWLKFINDLLYGVLIACQSFLQTGLTPGVKITYVLAGLVIAGLGAFANVLHDDYTPHTAVMKIVKDLAVSLINALGPALQAGLTSGASLVVILTGFSHTAFSIAGNTLEADLFGMTGSDVQALSPATATPVAAPTGAPVPSGDGKSVTYPGSKG